MLSNLLGKKIILASKSPRRKDLLEGLLKESQVVVEIRSKDVDESYSSEIHPKDVPLFLAEKKADEFLKELLPNEICITADTIVIHQNKILEKPRSFEEAQQMLRTLANSQHLVVTGVCIQSTGKKEVFSDHTNVFFGPLTDEEIDFYIKHYQPFDKAGSYGAQDWIGFVAIQSLEGSYFNVMGLPVHKVYQSLSTF